MGEPDDPSELVDEVESDRSVRGIPVPVLSAILVYCSSFCARWEGGAQYSRNFCRVSEVSWRGVCEAFSGLVLG